MKDCKKYPLGIQTFSEIVKGNYYYADKTAIVYQLAHYAKFHFLSRPRRFGKSLFVTTLQAYFEGKKELFKGLAIEKMEQEWTAYPVIHLDLSGGKYYSLENLHAILNNILSPCEKEYQISPDEVQAYGVRLKNIIQKAAHQTGKQVVVLIDEYDAPMHDSMADKNMQKMIRNILRDLFSPLKFCEADLRFVFITGISKFSQLSIFSELNNLKILSMKEEYSDVCGLTEEELLKYFQMGIHEMAVKNRLTDKQVIDRLREHYDGYHFTGEGSGLYNPYSIINALDDKKFNSYWFSSGTPTFLIELLQKMDLGMLDLDDIWAQESRFDVPTEDIGDPIPVLYQSGYLTIKEYNDDLGMYRLGFPNEEVRKGFSESLYRYYAPTQMGDYDAVVLSYRRDVLLNNDMAAFLPHLKTFYDKFPYSLINNNERHYQAVMYTIFAMLGTDLRVEQQTSDGRMDVVVKTPKNIYVFELKYKKNAEVALQQIDAKNYAAAFADDARPVVKVGINFSEDQRTMDDWMVWN